MALKLLMTQSVITYIPTRSVGAIKNLGRKHDGPPGPKVMWIGMQRIRDFVIAMEAQRALIETCV